MRVPVPAVTMCKAWPFTILFATAKRHGQCDILVLVNVYELVITLWGVLVNDVAGVKVGEVPVDLVEVVEPVPVPAQARLNNVNNIMMTKRKMTMNTMKMKKVVVMIKLVL